MTSESATAAERVILAFQERYWSDEAEGSIGSLADYITLWPEHELIIAQEYMTLRSGASTADGSDAEGLDRIGPYLLEDEIGRGGQGLVYRAKDERLGRTVALKVLTGLGPGAEKQIARFKREAEVAARLEHPGICGVHDAGVENGVPYIAMRFVEGETLQQRISRTRQESMTTAEEESFLDLSESAASGDGPLEDRTTDSITTSAMPRSQIDAILQVFEKTARALHAAHEAGVVHRDVKPGNIMITRDGEPVLLDFGLAQDDSQDGQSLTMTGDLFGTPAYMSPEQIAGHRIQLDGRSDVYALGVTLYESLTLRRPWEAPTREALYQAIMTKEAPDPRRLNKAISKDLKVVLECALEKDRDRRYSSAQAFADDLAAVREGLPVAASPIGPLGRAWRWSKRRPMRAALLLVLAVGIPLITGLSGFIFANLDEIEAQRQAELSVAVEARLEAGLLALDQRQLESGIEELRKAIELDPKRGESWALLGLGLSGQRRFPEALEALERAVSLGVPERDLAGLERSIRERHGLEIESPADADADADAGVGSDIRSPLGWYIKVAALADEDSRMGDPSGRDIELARRMLRGFERALQASPHARRFYHFLCMRVASRAQDRETCLVLADSIEALWGDDPVALAEIGSGLQRLDPERSIAALRRASATRPAVPRYRILLAASLAELGRVEDCRAVIAELDERDDLDVEETHMIMNVFRRIMDHDAVVRWGNRVLALDPEHAEVHNSLGLVLHRTDPERALEHMREFVRKRPEASAGRANLSMLLRLGGRSEEALEEARLAKALDPTHQAGFVREAQALKALGRLDEARRSMEDALALDSRAWQAHLGAGALYRELGEHDRSIDLLEDAVRRWPRELSLQGSLMSSYLEAGRFEDAVNIGRRLTEIAPEDAGHFALLVSAFSLLGRDEEALEAFERARSLDPESIAAWNNLMMAHEGMGRWEDALSAARRVSELKSRSALSLKPVADYLVMLGRCSEAEAIAREAIALDPEDPAGHEALATALRGLGRGSEAIAEFELARSLGSDDPEVLLILAELLHQEGRQDEALELMGDAASRHPGDFRIVASLAGLHAARRNLEASAVWSARALELDPSNHRMAMLLVSARVLLGDRAVAEDAARAHIERNGLRYGQSDDDFVRRLWSTFEGLLQARSKMILLESGISAAIANLDERLEIFPELAGLERTRNQLAMLKSRSEEDRRSLRLATAADLLQGARVSGRVFEVPRISRAALRLDPDSIVFLNSLAWALVDPEGAPAIRDPKEALPLARRAVALSERKAAGVLDTLAVARFADGQVEEAVAVQEEILRLMGGKDAGSYKLADAQGLLDKYRAALKEKEAAK